MSQQQWTAVDDYFTRHLAPSDPALDAALRDSDTAGLPPQHVAPNQGKLLQLLAEIQGARRILEIGTLAGYSTIWLARALPDDGQLVTLEASAAHAAVAQRNLERAGVAHRVELRVGQALDSLARLTSEGAAPFDLIFIDADKPNNPHYLEAALQLSRPGTLIVADNVVRQGGVIEAASPDASVQGVRRFTEQLAANPRLSSTAIQTVGSKGWDGFALIRVRD
ncbi:O-methyltransferase [Neisseriaceae bacterium JH1-16]|nr:O-methyltransferase [Neisseriaceae bacterium JH1-16]